VQAKAILRVIGALVPIVYFGGLFFYFFHTAGSVEEAQEIGLGPTLLGLAVVSLLFCIPLVWNILRLMGTRPRGPNGHGGESDFDADAVVARYLARQPAQNSAGPPAQPPKPGGAPPKPTVFGRKR
jgi:hypothetical protein